MKRPCRDRFVQNEPRRTFKSQKAKETAEEVIAELVTELLDGEKPLKKAEKQLSRFNKIIVRGEEDE